MKKTELYSISQYMICFHIDMKWYCFIIHTRKFWGKGLSHLDLKGLFGLAEDLLVSIKPKGLGYYCLFQFELCAMQSWNWQGNMIQFIRLISAYPPSEGCLFWTCSRGRQRSANAPSPNRLCRYGDAGCIRKCRLDSQLSEESSAFFTSGCPSRTTEVPKCLLLLKCEVCLLTAYLIHGIICSFGFVLHMYQIADVVYSIFSVKVPSCCFFIGVSKIIFGFVVIFIDNNMHVFFQTEELHSPRVS